MNESEIRQKREKLSAECRICVKNLEEIRRALQQLDLDGALLADRNIRNHYRQLEERLEKEAKLFQQVLLFAYSSAGLADTHAAFWEPQDGDGCRR